MNIPIKKLSTLLLIFIGLTSVIYGCQNSKTNSFNNNKKTIASPKPTATVNSKVDSNKQSTSGINIDFIKMINTESGWAVSGNKILTTADNCKHWINVTPSNSNIDFTSNNNSGFSQHFSYFYDNKKAWIVSLNDKAGHRVSIYYTINGGKRWNKSHITLDKGDGSEDAFINFIDDKHGWLLLTSEPAAGLMGKTLFYTDNGGADWKRLSDISDVVTEGYPSSLSFINSTEGFITIDIRYSHSPAVYYTNNKGINWRLTTMQKFNGNEYPRTIIPQYNNLIIIANINSANGVISIPYTIDNEAITYKPNTAILNSKLYDFTNNKYGWVISTDNELYKTNDLINWNQVDVKDLDVKKITQLDFINENIGWAIYDKKIYNTTNGGTTWSKIPPSE